MQYENKNSNNTPFSCLLTISASAQTTVSSMTKTTDFIPGDNQRRDYNNKPCELVEFHVLDKIAEIAGKSRVYLGFICVQLVTVR